MMRLRTCTSLGLAALIAACSPGGDAAPGGNKSELATDVERRPSAPARLSHQELAIRIGPRCPETTDIAYSDRAGGGAEYVVTCGPDRFRVIVSPDGATKIETIGR